MAIWTGITLFVAFTVAAVALFYKKKFQFWKNLGFPYADPSFPMGNIQGVGSTRSTASVVNDLYNQYPNEKFVGFWTIFQPQLLIRDPDIARAICVEDFEYFRDRGHYTNEKDDPLSAHIFNIGGEKWRFLRSKLSPAMTPSKIKIMFPLIAEACEQLRKIMDIRAVNNEIVEMKDIASRFAIDAISSCAFGINANSLADPNSDLNYYGQRVFQPSNGLVIKRLLLKFLPRVSEFLSFRLYSKEISDFFTSATRNEMDHRVNNNVQRNDFIDLLMQLMSEGDIRSRKVGDRRLTFEEAAAQAFVFFLAGFEGSSAAVQFALYELAKNPEIQKLAREEINKVIAHHKGEITYECVTQMKHLTSIVHETLRLHPSLPFLMRKCNQDYRIPGTNLFIPKGVMVVIDSFGLHHDPKYYSDPDKFDPGRFSDDESAKRHSFTYVGFGKGPRNCPGYAFGMIQTKMALVTLLANFEFSVVPQTPIPMVYCKKAVLLAPEGGMHLRVRRLKD